MVDHNSSNDSSDDEQQRVTIDQLPDAIIEDIINSEGFQKMLAYRRLSDGLDVLREQGQLYDSMVTSITKQHTNVSSEKSVDEFFDLFIAEVESYTDGLVDEDENAPDNYESQVIDDLMVDE